MPHLVSLTRKAHGATNLSNWTEARLKIDLTFPGTLSHVPSPRLLAEAEIAQHPTQPDATFRIGADDRMPVPTRFDWALNHSEASSLFSYSFALGCPLPVAIRLRKLPFM